MFIRPPHLTRSARLLWLVACAVACTGTPTPEPPDNLPTPDAGSIFGASAMPADVSTGPAVCQIASHDGAVTANSKVWVVDLDTTSTPEQTVQAGPRGAFSAKLEAKPGDRIRIVARSDDAHSLPVDVACTGLGMTLSPTPLAAQGLSCLELKPVDVTVVVAAETTRTTSFALTNHCTEHVGIVGTRLRFGDQGFAIAQPPSSLPVGATVQIEIDVSGHDDDLEHADILLLNVGTDSGQTGRYALGVWSVSMAGAGKD